MVPDELPVDTETTVRDRLRHELFTSLTVIATRSDLLRRQILRADGLTTLERDHLLDGLAATRTAAERLHEQLEALLRAVALAGAPPESVVAAHPPPGASPRPESTGRA